MNDEPHWARVQPVCEMPECSNAFQIYLDYTALLEGSDLEAVERNEWTVFHSRISHLMRLYGWSVMATPGTSRAMRCYCPWCAMRHLSAQVPHTVSPEDTLYVMPASGYQRTKGVHWSAYYRPSPQ